MPAATAVGVRQPAWTTTERVPATPIARIQGDVRSRLPPLVSPPSSPADPRCHTKRYRAPIAFGPRCRGQHRAARRCPPASAHAITWWSAVQRGGSAGDQLVGTRTGDEAGLKKTVMAFIDKREPKGAIPPDDLPPIGPITAAPPQQCAAEPALRAAERRQRGVLYGSARPAPRCASSQGPSSTGGRARWSVGGRCSVDIGVPGLLVAKDRAALCRDCVCSVGMVRPAWWTMCVRWGRGGRVRRFRRASVGGGRPTSRVAGS